MAGETSAGRWLGVAALSATASSLLTYAVFKWHHSSKRLEDCDGATATTPQRRLDHDGFAGYPEALQNGSAHEARDPCDPSPRTGYLSWDDYFMAVAFLSAQRSKDPNKQVGACIVDRNNVICGIGYNGFPRGCPDSRLPWAKRAPDGDPLRTKYPYVCHAEMNAILNKNGASVAGARVFVTMFPCNECAKLMIQAGIAEIVYHEDKAQPRAETPAPGAFKLHQQYAASKLLLSLAGVAVRQHLFRRPVSLHLNNLASRVVSAPALAYADGEEDGAGGQGGAAAAGALLDTASETGDEFGDVEEDEDGDVFATARAGGSGGGEVLPALAAVLAAAADSGGDAPDTGSSSAPAGKVLQFDDVA